MKSLVVVESPAKARTISRILGDGFSVKASVGHIIDLPEKELGVDIEHGFKPSYQVIQGKGKVISELKKAAAESDRVLLATDPDREGEAIAYHIVSVVSSDNKPIGRVLFHEITRSAVLKAVENPGRLDMQKVEAQQARRVLDRLVGYLVSPILWQTVAKGLSAGRVQSVALRLVCEREAEIKLFVTQEYWTIDAGLRTRSGEEFTARAHRFKDKKLEIGAEPEVKKHLAVLQRQDFILKDRKEKEVIRRPHPPFITSTLQQEASKRLNLPTLKTMQIAQSLYEGVELGDKGVTGLITYMRTDSVRSAPEAVAAARDFIAGTYGVEYLPPKARVFKTKGRAQEAHEAIRPTSLKLEPGKVKKFLSKQQFQLYKLIFERFIASQMADAIFNQTTLEIAAGDYLFRASDSVPVFRGFLQVWADLAENGAEEAEKQTRLPKKIAVGEKLDLLGLFPEQHFTEPPPRYNEATLVKALEENGIGRPSTYAAIISTLFDRKYIIREERKLLPAELGETVNNILVNYFPDIFNVDFTASMENRLDDIEAGSLNWAEVVEDFYLPFRNTLEAVKNRKAEIKSSLLEKTGEKCEKCGSDMIIRWGKNGRFIACSAFPACRNTRPLEQNRVEPKVSGKTCPKCGSELVVKDGRYGKFLGCSQYPKCKHIEPIDIGVKCPKEGCGGKLVERRSKKGRVFYGCGSYPKCDFVTWYKPVDEKCPACGNVYLEVHQFKEGEAYVCPQCKHRVE